MARRGSDKRSPSASAVLGAVVVAVLAGGAACSRPPGTDVVITYSTFLGPDCYLDGRLMEGSSLSKPSLTFFISNGEVDTVMMSHSLKDPPFARLVLTSLVGPEDPVRYRDEVELTYWYGWYVDTQDSPHTAARLEYIESRVPEAGRARAEARPR